MDIILNSQVLKVKRIVSKTRAQMFKNLKVGDRITLSVKIKRTGIYAISLNAKNLNTGESVLKTFNQITPILKCFEFEEQEG